MTSHLQPQPRPLNGGLVVPRGTAPDLVAAVKLAEERGVKRVWTTVGGASSDPVTSYAAVATQTRAAVLGTSVTPTYPRHPITLAAQAITLDELAPGRIRLGIGTSHRPIIEGIYGIPMGTSRSRIFGSISLSCAPFCGRARWISQVNISR